MISWNPWNLWIYHLYSISRSFPMTIWCLSCRQTMILKVIYHLSSIEILLSFPVILTMNPFCNHPSLPPIDWISYPMTHQLTNRISSKFATIWNLMTLISIYNHHRNHPFSILVSWPQTIVPSTPPSTIYPISYPRNQTMICWVLRKIPLTIYHLSAIHSSWQQPIDSISCPLIWTMSPLSPSSRTIPLIFHPFSIQKIWIWNQWTTYEVDW